MANLDIGKFKEMARNMRKEILETIANAGSGHPGGSLSCVEILISLYFYKMNHKPQQPEWPERDRFIMSKGHASPAHYVVLANAGYFDKKELAGFRKFDSMLQGHVHIGVPGVELSTGSLGQGLSVANGFALSTRLSGLNFNVYCLLGDGEIQEGSVWEAAMSAGHHKISNICAILDCNKVQENGPTKEIKTIEPVCEKFKAFNWHTIEIDGHDFEQICSALDEFTNQGKPTFIKANTVKGKGVSFMEYNHKWHGKAPSSEELKKALIELGF